MADEVTDDTAKRRYELRVDGELAGFIDYREDGTVRDLHHTEIFDRFGGKGLGKVLVAGALDLARAGGYEVVPGCPFIQTYLHRNPDAVELVPADRRAQYGLN